MVKADLEQALLQTQAELATVKRTLGTLIALDGGLVTVADLPNRRPDPDRHAAGGEVGMVDGGTTTMDKTDTLLELADARDRKEPPLDHWHARLELGRLLKPQPAPDVPPRGGPPPVVGLIAHSLLGSCVVSPRKACVD